MAGRVLPGQRYQVESFFPSGYPPHDAKAKVLHADGSVLAEGNLDDKGIFVFHYYSCAENLRVIIHAVPGTIDEHTATLLIPSRELAGSGGGWCADGTTAAPLAGEIAPMPFTEETLVLATSRSI